MTVDLQKLAESLKKDTPEKLLERRLEQKKSEIIESVRRMGSFVLDRERNLVIKRRA
jgi:hypothetical protein